MQPANFDRIVENIAHVCSYYKNGNFGKFIQKFLY